MRLIAIMLFVCIGLTYASDSYSQSATLTLNVNNKTVQEVLDEIEKQSEFRFFYNNKQVNTNRVVSIQSKKKDVFNILEQLFNGTDISYKVLDKSIILSPKEMLISAVAQQSIKTISGTITDSNGEPIIGANVLEKGSTNGTITDINGKFSLSVPDKSTLIISYIGYVSKAIIVGNQTVFNIQLTEDTQNLNEVVVTALGIKREEKALGYAVQKVKGDNLTIVKSVDVGTAITGKIAGLNVQNSSEFNEAPSIQLRGETPLLVVDGVPYGNITLRDIASDDIESIDVLKGATASALYGSRGGSGAIMVTTKRGKEEGLNVSINSNTMFDAGFLRLPEVQTSYSTGMNGKYNSEDFVWGDKMDIGRTATQWDPIGMEWKDMPLISKGKNNFKNFLEQSIVTNNNISVVQKGKYGSVRTSLTHIYNKGQYPNTKLNKLTYTVSGDMKWKDFTFEGGLTYNKRFYPNNEGTGYGTGGYIYSMLVWTGTDLDIRDYKNYWQKKNEVQNWPNKVWYDNPYFIANEIIHSSDYDVVNGFMNAKYDFAPWLRASLRTGVDVYTEREIWRNSIGACGGWNKKGYYEEQRKGGYSVNNDIIISADKKFGDFSIDGFVGTSLYFYQDDVLNGKTSNGITIPGYYSLKASVDPAKVYSTIKKKQVNSLYGKVSGSWKSTLFLDITARNDWSSTLPVETRSYFYPSISGSLVISELFNMPQWFDFWKIRASWTQTKSDLGVYETDRSYSISTNLWDNMNGATYPTTMRSTLVEPSATRTYEIGTGMHFLKNRLQVDIAYYNKLYYNLTKKAAISDACGFEYTLINTNEEHVRKGVEVTVSANIIQSKDWDWITTFNWSLDRYYYSKIDPIYSTQKDWVKPGERWDWLGYYDWERDPYGNIIHDNGYPIQSKYQSVAGYENPDWIFGFNNTVRYKDFTLSFTLDGRIGGVAHSVMDQALWMTGAHRDSDTFWRYDEVVNGNKSYIGEGVKVVSGSVEYDSQGHIVSDTRVFDLNDKAVSYEGYMKLYNGAGNVWNAKHQHILKQTFIKLRELSLNYNIPQNICNKIGMKRASIAFVGNNLFLLTKDFKFSDPDKATENLNSPSLRMLGCNIKINF
ncbi:SusC/RagA family TonB-linked outer membrane protein [Parabacteroides massiliensis]|uniref:SusC/RagA family TonB-linked outer membrane protein n=1 Tax=Parabacteroides massiliensis TaxID=1750560 RepID=UPI00096A43A8|nr:SusC/RagA family TonB-linked outer membrane protein [Parabacteroides massiliensis]